jgi:hypothetical protein
MANNQVEIDVVLNAEQAEKGFDKLEQGSKAVGESFSSVGKAVSSLGGEANKALGGVGESLSGVVDGFTGLASAAKTTGASFTALAGPIGIAVMAVMELINAFREYGNEVDGTNIKVEAYAASATELTSIIEQLSDAQVTLNKETIKAFRIQSQNAQGLINQGELINQNTAEIKGQILEMDKSIKQAQKNLKISKGNLQAEIAVRSTLNSLIQNRTVLVDKLSKLEAKADDLSLRGAKERKKLTEMVEGELKKSPEFIKKQRELEAKLTSEANRNQLQATKDTVKSQIEIARLGSQQKIRELKAIEDISEEVRSKAIAGERARLQAEITAIEKSFANKRKVEAEKRRQKRQADRAREAAMELAKARQQQAELKNLRSLELESMKLQGASALDLARERYNDELALAGDNQNQILIATKRFENEKTRIQQAEQKQSLANERQLAEQRSNFIYSTLEFDAQQIEDQTARELALLDLRYKKEISLNEHTQAEITEIQRREAIERQKILDQSFNESMDTLKSMGQDLLKESTSAIYQSLVDAGQFDLTFEELKYDFDQKVGQAREEMLKAQASNDVALYQQKEQEITNLTAQYESERQQIRAQESQTIPLLFGNILKGLGQQASVEAVMELAKGFSKLGSPLTAGFAPAHFKASAIFAGVAATAGVGGAILTNNANTAISRAGRGGGGGSTSPTGTPQTATTPQREQAETSSMVFNINFGGAVIYDTQRAAEQALADRITNLQNTRRRGAPRRGAM